MRQQIKHLVTVLGMVLAMVLTAVLVSAPIRAEAQTRNTVSVTLHKLLFAKGQVPSDTNNNGITSPFGSDGTPLNGATFTVYDVTHDFWAQNPRTEAEIEAAQNKLAANSYTPTTKVAAVTTSGRGEATFSQLPLRSGGNYAVYLFKETKTPTGVKGGQNIVLVLPLAGTTNQIDLYPKNEAETGGARFVKVDADDHSQKLANAKFVVANAHGKYLTKVAGQHVWQTISGDITDAYTDANAVVLTSNEAGKFVIDGLDAGKYKLVEVQAPDGYVRRHKAVAFTVTAGETSKQRQTVVVENEQQPHPPLPNTFGKIIHHWKKHIHKFLPQTGEARATWASIIGLFLLVTVMLIVGLKKKKQNKGEF